MIKTAAVVTTTLLWGAVAFSASAETSASALQAALSSTLTSPTIQRAIAGQQSVLSTSGNTPLISEVRLYGEIVPGKEDKKVGLKIYPRGWGESSAASHLKTAIDKRITLETQSVVAEELRARYEVLTRGAVALKKRDLLAVQMKTVESLSAVVKQRLRANQADPKTLLSVESDIQKARMDLDQAESELSSYRNQVAGWSTKEGALENLDTTETERILASVPEPHLLVTHVQSPGLIQTNPVVLYQATRAEEARSESDLENAAAYRLIDSIDIGGEWDDKKSQAAIGLSLNLPFFRPNGVDRASKLASAVREETKLEIVRRQSGSDLESMRKRLIAEINTYNTLSQSESLQTLTRLKELLSKTSAHADVTVLLLAREKLASQHLALLSLLEKSYETYLEYLSISGKLAETPYRNYLSPAAESL